MPPTLGTDRPSCTASQPPSEHSAPTQPPSPHAASQGRARFQAAPSRVEERNRSGWGLHFPHVKEGESLGARRRGHPPTCSLWSRRQEHLWQLLPGPLWSDVNRGEPTPTPGQGRTGLWLKDQSPGCLHVERCREARASGDRSEPCSLITLRPVSHRTGLRWRLH